jgi:hypothetical protein
LACNAVVEGWHPREFSIEVWRWRGCQGL